MGDASPCVHIHCWGGKSWLLAEQRISLRLDGNLSPSSLKYLALKVYFHRCCLCTCPWCEAATLYINLCLACWFFPSDTQSGFPDAHRICGPLVSLRMQLLDSLYPNAGGVGRKAAGAALLALLGSCVWLQRRSSDSLGAFSDTN